MASLPAPETSPDMRGEVLYTPTHPASRITLDAETLRKMVEEYTGAEVAEILRAVNGLPEPERLRAAPESPWASVAAYLAIAAIAITWILTHA